MSTGDGKGLFSSSSIVYSELFRIGSAVVLLEGHLARKGRCCLPIGGVQSLTLWAGTHIVYGSVYGRNTGKHLPIATKGSGLHLWVGWDPP